MPKGGTGGCFTTGVIRGLGCQVVHEGGGGLGGSIGPIGPPIGPPEGPGARDLGIFFFLSIFLGVSITRQAGWADGAFVGGGIGASGARGFSAGASGFQSGANSPPGPCWLFRDRSWAISNCSALRSSRSLPTSCNSIRTSDASALLKSLMYFGASASRPVGLWDMDFTCE